MGILAKLTGFLQVLTSKNIASTVIGIDMRHGAIHYYSLPKGAHKQEAVHHVRFFAAPIFSEEFNMRFREALAEFAEAEPSQGVRRVALVLPDEAVALDHFRFPQMRTPRQLENALDAKLGTIYDNRNELQMNTVVVDKNKENVTYAVGSIRKHILDDIYAACSENRMLVVGATTVSAAAVTEAIRRTPSLGKENFLFLDIKDTYSRYSFVIGGRVAGGYTLPFGLEFLREGQYVQEDMLFDHTLGELTVLNARERARAKKLTMLEAIGATATEEEDEDAPALESVTEEVTEQTEGGGTVKRNQVKYLPKKTPRKLPQFMLREIPTDPEGITHENFRVFVKWGLGLLRTNPTVTALGMPKQVVVNLPPELSYVTDALAAEEKEMGLPFVRFTGADADAEIGTALELMGGMVGGKKKANAALRF